jgi:hypothetical protein
VTGDPTKEQSHQLGGGVETNPPSCWVTRHSCREQMACHYCKASGKRSAHRYYPPLKKAKERLRRGGALA